MAVCSRDPRSFEKRSRCELTMPSPSCARTWVECVLAIIRLCDILGTTTALEECVAEVCYNVVISAAGRNVRWPAALEVLSSLARSTSEPTAAGHHEITAGAFKVEVGSLLGVTFVRPCM